MKYKASLLSFSGKDYVCYVRDKEKTLSRSIISQLDTDIKRLAGFTLNRFYVYANPTELKVNLPVEYFTERSRHER